MTRRSNARTAGAIMQAMLPAFVTLAWTPEVSAQGGIGEALFKQHCSACHQADGSGTPGLAPPLANALTRQLAAPRGGEFLAQVLVAGMAGPLTSMGQSYNSAMPGVASLPDDEIATIANYVARALNGAAQDLVTRDDVAAARQRHSGPVESLRLRRTLLGAQP
jgi:mono/diheme cytochrome c family protein